VRRGAGAHAAPASTASGTGAAPAVLPLPLLARGAAAGLSSAGGSPNSPLLRQYERVQTNVLSPARARQASAGLYPSCHRACARLLALPGTTVLAFDR